MAKKGTKEEYNVTFENREKINAPSKIGDVVGKVIVSKDGNVLKEIELVLKSDIEALSLKDCFDRVVNAW